MPLFTYFPVPAFVSKLEKIEKHDPPGYTRILDVIDRILSNPSDADGWMHGEHKGQLKKYVGRSDYRILYNWCELCRNQEKKLEEKCGFCQTVGDNSVIFFNVYHKNEASRV